MSSRVSLVLVLWYPPRMRFVIVGLVLLLSAIGLSEYARRHPAAKVEGEAAPPPAARPALLDTETAAEEAPADPAPFSALLQAPEGIAAVTGFSPVVRTPVEARALCGGFGAVLFVLDARGGSAIVRAAVGEGARVVAARSHRVGALHLDGSTAFFSEDGTVWSMSARGGEAPAARVRFSRATVTSLHAVGDDVYVTLVPSPAAGANGEAAGAVVKVGSDGVPVLLAADQVRPRAVVADGKDVFWIAGDRPGLWRASTDGSFSSRVLDEVEGPLALDREGVVFRAEGGRLARTGRAGGTPTVVTEEGAEGFIVSGGLVRFFTARALFEVAAGGTPSELIAPPGTPQAVAEAGTSTYLAVGRGSETVLYAR